MPVDPNNTSVRLVADLDKAIDILTKAGETFWRDWLQVGRDQIAAGDWDGVAHVFRAFGGEVSFDRLRIVGSAGFETPEQSERADERLWDVRESIWRLCRELQRFRSRFKLLKISSPDEVGVEWTPERLRERLIEDGYEGLDLLGRCKIALGHLGFLVDLDQMRILGVETPVKDDRAAFTLTGLQELALLTGCRRPVPECELPVLRRLVLVERDGIESRKWPVLEELLLGVWRSNAVPFLDGGTRLRDVELQGKGQDASLDGIETCERLESLRVLDATVEDLTPLRALSNLRELKLSSRQNPTGSLDLSAITSPVMERIWLTGVGELRNLSSLNDLPSLCELQLGDCPLTDADRVVLDRLADRVEVTILT